MYKQSLTKRDRERRWDLMLNNPAALAFGRADEVGVGLSLT